MLTNHREDCTGSDALLFANLPHGQVGMGGFIPLILEGQRHLLGGEIDVSGQLGKRQFLGVGHGWLFGALFRVSFPVILNVCVQRHE